MRIVVLGGAGNMGSAMVQTLAQHSSHDIIVGDSRLDAAARVADAAGDKVSAIEVDVTDRDSLASAIKSGDLVVNCVGPFYRYAPAVCLTALQRSAHYVDICDDDDATHEMLTYDAIARANGVTAVLGAGWTPGITNICARRGTELLDEAHTIDIVWVGSASDTPDPAGGIGVVQHVFHAINRPVPMFQDGRWVMLNPLEEDLAEAEAPEPLGSVKAYYCGHPEPVTLPRFLPGLRNVSVRGALVPPATDELFATLTRMGFADTEERIKQAPHFLMQMMPALAAQGYLNAPPASAAIVEIKGLKDGKEETLRYTCIDRMHRLTGIPCAIAARLVAEGRVAGPGVLAPEAAFDAQAFLDELAQAGITVEGPAPSHVHAGA
jgi:lysine 6-dehydrogenase